FHRTEIGVEVERFPKLDVGAAETLAYGRRQRSLQGEFISPDRVQQLVGDRLALPLERFRAGEERLPFDFHARGFNDFLRRARHFGSDPVARYQRRDMLHSMTSVIERSISAADLQNSSVSATL